MVKTKINGIPIEMPYEPYAPQLVTISKLLSCFQNNTSALIESPTGTGKSLSIICSVLGYNNFIKRDITAEDKDKKPFKIFICSRTHKQLDQLVEQLRKTVYRPRITILGSKAHYCINPKLKDVQDKNTACSDLIKTGGCVYFNGKDRLIKKMADRIFDIEELKIEGKKCIGCPYFTARALVEDADVIFAPYNYLIDTKVRESTDISMENAIVIIDEAHNIEDVCRTAGSLEITSKLIDIISNEILGAIKRSALLGSIKTEFVNLFDFFRKLKEYSEIEEFDTTTYDSQIRIKKGNEIIGELEKIGVAKEVFLLFKNSLKAIAGDDEAKELINLATMHILEDVERIIGMLLFVDSEAYAFCFQKFNNEAAKYCYNFWLLDPGVMFRPLVQKVKSVSLLSGTLTPFSSFSSELKYAFEHKVIAPHILRDDQVFIANIKKGHLKQELCGTYATSETFGYLDQISTIIIDIANSVKPEGGTLVFVPSYIFLNKLSGRISDAIVEPKTGGMVEFEKALNKYKARINKRQSAIFLCVYRGKAAEGIDFKDEFARAVIAVGIPYPSIRDPQIALKKEYNDKRGSYNGRMWYEAQAFRAVNQALGRAIRHSKDWGSVFLLDSRYGDKKYQTSLPSWVSSNMKRYDVYTDCSNDLKNFVQACKSSDKENKLLQ